jgi:hypothetical protein
VQNHQVDVYADFRILAAALPRRWRRRRRH